MLKVFSALPWKKNGLQLSSLKLSSLHLKRHVILKLSSDQSQKINMKVNNPTFNQMNTEDIPTSAPEFATSYLWTLTSFATFFYMYLYPSFS